MNWVDLAVLVILVVSALLGFSRGLVREMLGIGAWVGAAYVAFVFGPLAFPLARRTITDPDIADPVAYVVVFVVVLIVLSLVSNLVGRLVRVSALGGLDRTLGLVFGMARGALLVMAAYVVGGLVLPPDNWPPALMRARMVPLIYQGAAALVGVMPAPFRPRVAVPPEGRTTTAADLLHATPEGRALAPRTQKD